MQHVGSNAKHPADYCRIVSEHFRDQALDHLHDARTMRRHNQQLTRWTKQAARRERESIPACVAAARHANHLSIQWKRRAAQS